MENTGCRLVCNIILLSRYLLRCRLQGVSEVEFLYQIRTVGKMTSRFSRTFARAVAFPVYKVEEFPSKDFRIQDLVNFIFSLVFNYYRWWRVLLASRDSVW